MLSSLHRGSRFAALSISLACAASAMAQQHFPAKPVRLIVPFAPSGGQDTVARVLGAKLTESLGQQVVVDNRPGGSGIIAGESLLKSPADGHTLYLVSTSFVVAPALRKQLPYDTLKDFTAVSRIATSPGALVVHASLPARNVKQLIQLAKAHPGRITFGSAGVASQSHLSGELFKVLAGIDILHVPYKGSALATTALLSGEVAMSFANPTSTLQHVEGGKLRMLAVTTAERSPLFPSTPTMAEAGVPGFENSVWNGIVVSSATPKPITSELHDAIARAVGSPDFAEQLKRIGNTPFTGDTSEKFATFVAGEIAKWRKVVAQAGISAQ
jgi:tripartite-type tricarboxylate transporter receptor subunit TctC